MKTVVIIQARIGSSRLPAKVLLPLPTGRNVLQEVIHRCKQIEGIDAIGVACPDKDLDILENFIPHNVDVIGVEEGEHNVLYRYYVAAAILEADHVIRITADCPMLEPEVSSGVLRLHLLAGAYYTSNVWPSRGWPDGLDTEVFTRGALEEAVSRVDRSAEKSATCGDVTLINQVEYDREHVTPAIRRYAEEEMAFGLYKPMSPARHFAPRTLDTIEDYRRIWGMMDNDTA